MRTLTATLLAAQKKAAVTPYIKLEASNKIAGVVRYDWSRLYTGAEADYYHAMTMPGDGSSIRARIIPLADARKLYRQRVTGPGPGSDFSQWTYTNQYNAIVAAAASLGAEVSIFWINSSREIRRIKSTDNGATWASPELVDYSPSTAVYGVAAAYKANGDLAIFFADQATLYVKKNISGQWQTKAAWNKITGDLSGVACLYDADWNLMVTGRDTAGNFKLWSLVYGDDGDVTAGTWSALQELASAPSGGDFEYRQPFLDKTDVYRCFFIEKFTGSQAYSRPFWLHSVPDTTFVDSLWREPVPFNLSAEYGLALAHHGDYGWLSSPAGVWRTALAVQTLDLTADVVSVRQELGETGGALTVELRNDDGRYAALGEGNLAVLATGLWQARHQFRWNTASDDKNVKQLLALVLARSGLKLEVKSESAVITGFYPDFTISPGSDGKTVIQKLLSFVPDVLCVEGGKAYLVNPLASDGSAYSYGGEHRIYEGSYRQGGWATNRVQVEGWDTGGGNIILADSFAWDEIGRFYDRLRQVEDKNLGTAAGVQQRGAAYLRKAEINAASGSIIVPVNCGQQLYDVIDVTDARAGLVSEKKRVLGIVLVYQPVRGEYRQRLQLGAV